MMNIDIFLLVSMVTVKEQVFWFDEASVHVYVTSIIPTEKKNGEVADCIEIRPVPDRSKQVGSIQETSVPAVPSSTICLISFGRLVHSGGVVSTVNQDTNRVWQDERN